ncbi:uncharacterized protein LOC109855619 [Pseudomyrmex gracilis]|uniref:uncharacterized protein LOC109855619 n=1 Tax=Pseudomyrmex gracilis TaxID=219809 RepID=UPI000994FFD1|nr:uncharacterized protein LOC109855619 [Pseudomyrmex gracilis]
MRSDKMEKTQVKTKRKCADIYRCILIVFVLILIILLKYYLYNYTSCNLVGVNDTRINKGTIIQLHTDIENKTLTQVTEKQPEHEEQRRTTSSPIDLENLRKCTFIYLSVCVPKCEQEGGKPMCTRGVCRCEQDDNN